jgi:glycosyltransferase involved in cell wall biosynthesis
MRIVIGPVSNECGGVNRHILSIKKFSSHTIRDIPSKFNREVKNKSPRGIKFIFTALPLIKLFIIKDYDIVHSHVDPNFTQACLLLHNHDSRWVHTYHTIYFDEDLRGDLKPIRKKINNSLINVASRADIKISVSKWLHDYLFEKYSIQTNIIQNGYDQNSCNLANPGRFISRYNLCDFIIFVGSSLPEKNPAAFIELSTKIPEVTFVMIGKGLQKSCFYKRIYDYIPDNIIFLGELSYRDTLDAMAASKALVMTSKREGFPTVLLEAMGIGKPVIAPNHYGCKEIIQSKEFGYLYEPSSLDDLIEKTYHAIEEKNIGNKAKKRVMKNFDWPVLIKKIDSLYESLK